MTRLSHLDPTWTEEAPRRAPESRTRCQGDCQFAFRCRMVFTDGSTWTLHQCERCGRGSVCRTSPTCDQDAVEDYYDGRMRQIVLDVFDVWFAPWSVTYRIELPEAMRPVGAENSADAPPPVHEPAPNGPCEAGRQAE